MKKLFLFAVITAVASLCSMQAQIVSQMNQSVGLFSSTDPRSVVRNYDSNYVVGYASGKVSGVSKKYFYITEANEGITPLGASRWLEIPSGWCVKDICIDNGYAYFCGAEGTGNGLLGRFQVSSLISGSTVNIDYIHATSDVDTLYRLTVAHNTLSTAWAVAIGRKRIAISDINALTNIHYIELSDTADSETMFDVVQYHDTLYFWGTNKAKNALTVRRCRTFPLWLDPLLHTVNCYMPTVGEVDWHGCTATVMPSGKIAVAHQTVENSVPKIDLVVFDPVAMDIVKHQVYVNQHRVEFCDMRYMPVSQSLVLLYHDLTTTQTPVVEWKPNVVGSYGANAIIPDLRLYSLDRLTFDAFVSECGHSWFMQRTPALSAWQQACQPFWVAPVRPELLYSRAHYTATDPNNSLIPGTFYFNTSVIKSNTNTCTH